MTTQDEERSISLSLITGHYFGMVPALGQGDQHIITFDEVESAWLYDVIVNQHNRYGWDL